MSSKPLITMRPRGKVIQTDVMRYCVAEDGTQHLIKYDPQAILGPKAVMWWQGWAVATKSVALAVVGSIAVAFLAFLCIANPEDIDTSKITAVVSYLNGMVTFMLGFYSSTAIGRWWSMRNDTFGKTWGAIDELSLLCGAHFPGPECADLRAIVIRYGLLSLHLAFKQNRGEPMDDLVGQGLLSEDERAALNEEEVNGHAYASKPQVMWCWIAGIFRQLHAQGKLSSRMLPVFYQKCLDGRGGLGGLFTLTDCQLPFAYVHLLGFLVHLNNFAVACKCGVAIAVARHRMLKPTEENPVSQAFQDIVLQTFFLIFIPMIYMAFLDLGATLADPLGKEFLDFPLEAYHKYIQEECETFAHAGGSLPACVDSLVSRVPQDKTSWDRVACTTMEDC